MNLKTYLAVNGALIGAMAACSAWASSAGTTAGLALWLLPAIAVAHLPLGLLPYRLRSSQALEGSEKAHLSIWTGAVGLLAVVHAVLLFRGAAEVSLITGLLMCAFLMMMGNYATKLRQGYVYGVVTPWTRRSAYSWNLTHRVFGWMLVFLGASVIAASLAAQYAALSTLVFGGVALCMLVPSVLSYFFWKRDPSRL